MSWRTILIQNPAKVSLRLGQLLLKNDDGEYSIPLEDINVVIIDSPRVVISSSLLSAMQNNGVALLTCDERHMPNGVLLPFLPHSRNAKIAKMQVGTSTALRKRIWQKIIRNKIINQAECLKLSRHEEFRSLIEMAKKVRSGDAGNIEAQAAKYYWKHLFGENFRRGNSDIINYALNYSYAVIRACIARSLVAYGLIPCFGLHHDSELNAFNLADDIMEIFRPFADYKIWRMLDCGSIATDEENLSADTRTALSCISGEDVSIDTEIFTLSAGCDKITTGLVTAVREKDSSLLPEVCFPFSLS